MFLNVSMENIIFAIEINDKIVWCEALDIVFLLSNFIGYPKHCFTFVVEICSFTNCSRLDLNSRPAIYCFK